MQTSATGTPESPDGAAAPADAFDEAAARVDAFDDTDLDADELSAPSRWRRPRRYLLIGVAALLVIVLGGGLSLYLVANSKLDSIRSIKNPFAAIPAAQRPPVPPGALKQDVTFLVGGVDTRSPVPTTGGQAQSDVRGRTDTLMMVHLLSGGRGAYVVSIPRDSWVPIPGYGMGKVNWAYAFGGQTLAIRTVEQLTHVRIDHVAVIDWAGFKDLTNALGGVTIDIPVTTFDPDNGVPWTQGVHHLNGAQALLYVRDRYGLANGDFGREDRQQIFLRAVFAKLRTEASVGNALHMAGLADDLSKAVSVDNTLTNGDIEHLLLSIRSLDSGNILFTTVPYSGTGQAGTQSIVKLNFSLDTGFWYAFEHDTLPAFMQANALQPLGASTP